MPQHLEKSIDELVREVRSRAYEKIKTVHGTMRMLRVNRRVPVDDIYIELNVLEQVSCDRTFSDWRKDFPPNWRSFNRLGLEQAIEEGIPALDIVRDYPKLMVFGKPGSGKTTFLKSLATRCIDVERPLQWNHKDYVPIFITLRSFVKDASKQSKFSLFDYIYKREVCSWGEKNQQVVEAILEQGRALVLLDGLDEVQGQEYESVIEEVKSFCEYFHRNRFLITCRTQNHRYKFEGFTDVEVADFKPEQVNRFIKRWFAVVVANAESEKLAAELIGHLQQPENKQIAELAVTPVLLNLICSVFKGERGKLPKNRADLYKKGLRDLLEGLDELTGVQREPIYEKLTPEAKEDLLAYLAVTLFEANDYFPQQETLEKLIAKRLDVSRSKASKVLRSIEEHSGLIVERSEGFWSFSHLTFQEYFTAKWFCGADWQGLASHIREKHWREVFLLAAKMPRADRLLLLMKQQIDEQFAKYYYLQDVLILANEKSSKDYECIKPAVVRSFYLKLILQKNSPVEFLEIGNLIGNNNLVFGVELGLDLSFFKALHHAQELTRICEKDIAFPALAVEKKQITDTLYSSIQQALIFSQFEIRLQQVVKELKEQLPEQDSDQVFNNWWKANGKAWNNDLKNVMDSHRNIGRDLRFGEEQKEVLREYYYANKLLVDCLKSSFDVSADVKKKIEKTLLLPFDEMEKRQQQM